MLRMFLQIAAPKIRCIGGDRNCCIDCCNDVLAAKDERRSPGSSAVLKYVARLALCRIGTDGKIKGPCGTSKDKKNPDGDIEIHYTGLRPGEKLYEELLIGDNATGSTHPRIMRAEEEAYSWDEVITYVHKLMKEISQSNCENIRELLIDVVKGYQPSGEIEDVLWKDKRAKRDLKSVVTYLN